MRVVRGGLVPNCVDGETGVKYVEWAVLGECVAGARSS